MAEALSAAYLTGRTLQVEILRLADGFRLDWNDGTFKNSGWTTRLQAMAENAVTVGYFTLTPDASAWSDGYYEALLHDTAVTGGPISDRDFYVKSGLIERIGARAVAVSDKTGYALSAAGVQAVWDALSAALTTVGSIGKRIVDYLTGDSFTRLGAPANATIAQDIAEVESETDDIAAVRAKTDQLTFTNASKVDATAVVVSDKTGYHLFNAQGIVKAAAFPAFEFVMYDTAGAPKTGLTVTAKRSLDGGGPASTVNAPSEVGNGIYVIALAASDLNGDCVTLLFSADNASPTIITIFTSQP